MLYFIYLLKCGSHPYCCINSLSFDVYSYLIFRALKYPKILTNEFPNAITSLPPLSLSLTPLLPWYSQFYNLGLYVILSFILSIPLSHFSTYTEDELDHLVFVFLLLNYFIQHDTLQLYPGNRGLHSFLFICGRGTPSNTQGLPLILYLGITLRIAWATICSTGDLIWIGCV